MATSRTATRARAPCPPPKEVWGSQLEVSLFVGGKAESEESSASPRLRAAFTPKAAKVIFYK